MRRRIVFEIEAEGTENIIDSITKIMMDKVDLNCEFSISQEIVPERISEKKEIQIPAFLQNRCGAAPFGVSSHRKRQYQGIE